MIIPGRGGATPEAALNQLSVDIFSFYYINYLSANQRSHAIVSETMARRLWLGEDPIGKRIKYAGPDTAWSEVAGVVGDVKYDGLHEAPGLHVYAPQLQFALPYMAVSLRSEMVSAVILERLLSGLLYEVSTTDLATYALISLRLALAALLEETP